ncbi:MAG: VCBS repeat-containing protein [Ignavibacteria bacterium]|jgi:hypothetical protein
MKKIMNVIVCAFFITPLTALSQSIFSSQKVISNSIDGGFAIYLSDLDDDNDLDVISISTQDNILSWYENLDGQGSFGTPNVLSTSIHGGGDVCASDLDNDNDPDIIAASPTNESFQLAWFQNMDNNGTFSEAKTIMNNNTHTNSIFPADMDNDGDIDLLLAHMTSFVLFTNIDGSGILTLPKKYIMHLWLHIQFVRLILTWMDMRTYLLQRVMKSHGFKI